MRRIFSPLPKPPKEDKEKSVEKSPIVESLLSHFRKYRPELLSDDAIHPGDTIEYTSEQSD